jgi:acetyl-CoA carboxylase biotin carboxylase subunit
VHAALLADPEFTAGGVDTAFFERFLQSHRPDLVEAS